MTSQGVRGGGAEWRVVRHSGSGRFWLRDRTNDRWLRDSLGRMRSFASPESASRAVVGVVAVQAEEG